MEKGENTWLTDTFRGISFSFKTFQNFLVSKGDEKEMKKRRKGREKGGKGWLTNTFRVLRVKLG